MLLDIKSSGCNFGRSNHPGPKNSEVSFYPTVHAHPAKRKMYRMSVTHSLYLTDKPEMPLLNRQVLALEDLYLAFLATSNPTVPKPVCCILCLCTNDRGRAVSETAGLITTYASSSLLVRVTSSTF